MDEKLLKLLEALKAIAESQSPCSLSNHEVKMLVKHLESKKG